MSKGNNTKPVGIEESLFSLEKQNSLRKKKGFPYRSFNQKKKGSINRLWMELYPEPKKRTGGTTPSEGELF